MDNERARFYYKIVFKCLLLSLLLILLSESTKRILNLENLILNSLSGKLTQNQINHLFETQTKFKYLGYMFVPVILILKTVIITIVLYIGTFFYTKRKTTVIQLWNTVINSEFLFLLMGIVKLIWFCFFQTKFSLEEVQFFYPLSALNFIGHKELEPWLIYPLQTINLFELTYIVYLSYQLGFLTKTNPDTGIKIVVSSYIPALLLWVATVMFFTLNFS